MRVKKKNEALESFLVAWGRGACRDWPLWRARDLEGLQHCYRPVVFGKSGRASRAQLGDPTESAPGSESCERHARNSQGSAGELFGPLRELSWPGWLRTNARGPQFVSQSTGFEVATNAKANGWRDPLHHSQ